MLGHEIEKHANDLIRDIPDRLNISSFSILPIYVLVIHNRILLNSRKGTLCQLTSNLWPSSKILLLETLIVMCLPTNINAPDVKVMSQRASGSL